MNQEHDGSRPEGAAPGERGSLLAAQRLACGEIEVEDNLLVELR